MMKILFRSGLLLLVLFAGVASAETPPFKVFEADSLKIKLSNDGTGIVKDVDCMGCDFNIVNITKNSKASANGVDVSILEARSRANKPAMVSFDPNTREVQFIRWYK